MAFCGLRIELCCMPSMWAGHERPEQDLNAHPATKQREDERQEQQQRNCYRQHDGAASKHCFEPLLHCLCVVLVLMPMRAWASHF